MEAALRGASRLELLGLEQCAGVEPGLLPGRLVRAAGRGRAEAQWRRAGAGAAAEWGSGGLAAEV